MPTFTPPRLPSPDEQAQSNYEWTDRMLGLGRENTRIGHRGPVGQTRWEGNTLVQEYDPRVMGDLEGVLDSRAAVRNRLQQAMQSGFNPQGLPGLTSSVDPSSQMTGYDRSGFMDATPGDLMSGYGREGFIDIPGANDFTGERQRVEDAVYNRAATRLDKRFGRQKEDAEVALRNKGFVGGSEGYNRAMGDIGDVENDAYSSAMNDAILAGGGEQSRLLADALRTRGQQNLEGQTDVGLWNQAYGQDFGNRMALRGLQGQEAQTDLGNYNAATGRGFQERLAGAQFGNLARGQSFEEQMRAYQMPFQMSQYMNQTPWLPQQHSGTVGMAQPSSPSYSDFVRNSYMADTNRSNANTNWLNNALDPRSPIGGLVNQGVGAIGGAVRNWWESPQQTNDQSGANPGGYGMGNRGEDFVEPGGGGYEIDPNDPYALGGYDFPQPDYFDPSQFDFSQYDLG